MKYFNYIAILLIFVSCKYYNFTGSGGITAKTFQVNFFQNYAELIEPGVEREFTIALQDLLINQTNMGLVTSGGELIYEGEITDFRITPMTATADQRSAQNRVTMNIKVRFTNTLNEKDDFEKTFSFFHDYPADQQLIGSTLRTALNVIFERILQDIFNESLAKW